MFPSFVSLEAATNTSGFFAYCCEDMLLSKSEIFEKEKIFAL